MEKIRTVVFLGAGNLATQLARVLDEKGFNILQIYSRSLTNAQKLADEIGCYSCNDLNWLNKDADLYIFAVKDDAIHEIVSHKDLGEKMVVHTSGAKDDSILARVSDNYGVFYPLQTFSKSREVNWQEIPICIEANTKTNLALLEDFANTVSEKVIKTDFHQRRMLHVAAVFVNNFTNYLLQQASEITQANHLPFEILQALAMETVKKAFEMSPYEAQTGPAVRGDVNTIKAHKALLKEIPGALDIYTVLTKAIRKSHEA